MAYLVVKSMVWLSGRIYALGCVENGGESLRK